MRSTDVRRGVAMLALAAGLVVAVGEEHAIISWQDGDPQGGVVQIDLLLGVLSADVETGLIFPTPSPATVTLGDRADFDAIDRVTTPELVEDYDWWQFRAAGDGGAAGAPPDVLAVVQLSPIQAVTLAASDSAGLDETASTEYRVSVWLGLFGIPLGWLLVGGGVVIATIGVLVVVSIVGAKRS